MKRKIYFTLLLGIITTSIWAQAIQDPDDFHGPRTKWVIYPDVETTGKSRHSIIPQLDLPVGEWMKLLEETGANSATINLEARRGLKSNPMHETFALTVEQINNMEFTPEQRNLQLIDFLMKVQGAINRGEINGNIRFHVHQRLYIDKIKDREDQFIKDFSDFINLAKQYKLDHLLAGIRLGEHGKKGRNYIMEFTLRACQEINNNTDGWLKTHGFEMSGDDYGRYFVDINTRKLTPTFFADISKETGYFAFCYKAFGVGGAIKELGYAADSEVSYESGIRVGLGLDELIAFINTFKDQYPMHANVIFIGDSGDALKRVGNNQYKATTKIFTEAGAGFSGIIAVNGYRRPDKTDDDNYLYFYDALDGKEPVSKPKSIDRWKAWPYNDSVLANRHTVLAMSNLHGIIVPSGPVLVKTGETKEFKIIPEEGYSISKILVDGKSVAIDTIVTLSNITADKEIQVLYGQDVVRHTFIPLAADNGAISPSTAFDTTDGATVAYKITPDNGYYLKTLLVNGEEVSPDTALTFENVKGSYTVQAYFKEDTAPLPPPTSINAGSAVQTLTVYPNPVDSDEVLYIKTKADVDNIRDIQLIDLTGKEISSYAVERIDGQIRLMFTQDVEGVFIVRLSGHSTSYYQKIVVL